MFIMVMPPEPQSELPVIMAQAGNGKRGNGGNVVMQDLTPLPTTGLGSGIHIEGFDQNDVFNRSSISSFEFADGTARWRTRAVTTNSKAANDALHTNQATRKSSCAC